MAGPQDATGTVAVVSTSAAGTPGDRQSTHPVFSPDGKRVAFISNADNLVPGDTNGVADIFVKDLATGAITLVSANAAGIEGDSDSFSPVFSPDGTRIAFSSFAGNLVPGDADTLLGVFVKDLATGAVTMVSSSDTGTPVAAGRTAAPVFSADGSKVSFVTSSRLTPDDTNTHLDLYLKDLATGAVTRLSIGDGYLYTPVLSPDGTKFAVQSSYQLTPDATGGTQLYVQDVATGAVTLVSRAANNPDGTPGAVADRSVEPAVFSPDGSKVAFWSSADNLVPNDTNNGDDLFVKDLTTGAVTLVTASKDGAQGSSGGQNDPPVFSADGTKILFSSYGAFLVPGDTNRQYDVFEKDLITGEVTRLSTSADGSQTRFGGLQPALSPDGSKIAFLSGSNDLVPGVTPREGDIFVKEIAVAPPPNTAPVAGDDSYTATPGVALAVAGPGVLANDLDANGDALSVALVSGPAHGTLSLDATGAFTYTAAAGFHGQDSFTYSASDGKAQSGLATVTLSVDTAPVATGDHYTTRQNVPLTVAAGTGLLANDRDADGDHLSASLVSGPSHGTLALKEDGSFTYTPTTGYLGSDSFTYRDSDGITAGNVATVTLGVTANFGDVTRVSTDSSDGQIARGGNNPTFSPDGTKVAFWSSADISGQGDGSRLYIKDLATRTATVVWQETTPDYRSPIAFSSDNRTIAFESSTGFQIEDTQAGVATTLRHTGTFQGAQFSPNGSQIAFYTDASLMPGDTNGQVDVYIFDRPTSTLNRVSTAKDGSQGVKGGDALFSSKTLAFTPDGSKIVFSSPLDGLVTPPDGLTTHQVNSSADLYIKDLQSGDIRQLTHGDHDPVFWGETATYVDGSLFGINRPVTSIAMSPDGSKIAFSSAASNLVNGLTLSKVAGFSTAQDFVFEQIFVLELSTGQITVASATADGTSATFDIKDLGEAFLYGQGVARTLYPVFSPDSRKIAFTSWAKNLVPGDTNGSDDIFVKDLTSGAITRVSTTADGTQTDSVGDNNFNRPISFSPDGSKILLSSVSSDYVAGDTNDAIDVFLKTVRYPPTAVDDRWSPYAYQPLVVDAGRGVLANDISPSGSALTATLVSGPAHGTIDFHADGSFSYMDGRDPANLGQYYFGLDQFTYKVSDGVSDSGVATVHLGIFPAGGGGLWGFPRIGGSSGPRVAGDPHLVTFDGRAYDFQAVGEFTLVHATGVETQVRLGAVGPDVSSVTAVATRIGGTVVEIDAGTAHPLLIGGLAHDLADGDALTIGHGFVSRAANIYTVVGDTGDGFSAGLGATFLDLQLLPSSGAAGRVSGLLGNADGDAANDLALADGTVLSGEVSSVTLYGAFADSWRVSGATSLFTYAAGQSTESFTDRSFPAHSVTLDDLDPAVRAAAEKAVHDAGLTEGTLDFRNAVLDVALTGNPDYAKAAGGLATATGELHTLVLQVSEDAYQGDAQFLVLVDGKLVGGAQTVTASHAAGAVQEVTLAGAFGDPASVEVRFANDLYGGSADQDRNLYVASLTYDGHHYAAQAARITGGGYSIPNGAELYAPGAITFALHPDTLTFKVAEDAYQGDAQFAVYVDGRPVSGPLTVTASHAGGETQDITVEGNFADPSKIEIRYLNDLYGGSASQDRNLYVDSLTYDGHTYGARSATITGGGHPTIDGASLYAAGSVTFDTGLAGADTLVFHVTQDAYNGDAQFIVLVDGHQVGGTQTAHAAYKSATPDTVTLHGDFGSAHDVSVRFVNDAYGGSVSTDRNLYVLDASLNGRQGAGTSATYDTTVNHARGDAAALYVNGNATFHFDLHA